MEEQELTERLVKMEERSKSNTHRLDKLEPIIDEIHTMSKTMVQLVGEVQHTNENVAEIKDKVEVLENKPSNTVEHIKTAIITAAITAFVGGAVAVFFF